jgi:hypothetical protein
MKIKTLTYSVVLGLSVAMMGCVAEEFLISVNLEDLSATYAIPPGDDPDWSGSEIIRASDYLNQDFGSIAGVRIYDIKVQVFGDYSGDVTGQAYVNGDLIVSFAGAWSEFTVEQTLLTSPLITVEDGGVAALVSAVLSGSDVQLDANGTLSDVPLPEGLTVQLTLLGQVDAET